VEHEVSYRPHAPPNQCQRTAALRTTTQALPISMSESGILFRRRALTGTVSSRLPSQRSIDCSSRLNSGSLLKHRHETLNDRCEILMVRFFKRQVPASNALLNYLLPEPSDNDNIGSLRNS